MNSISLRESIGEIIPVLPHTFNEVGCHTDVERAVSLAGKNVHAWLVQCLSTGLTSVTPAKAGVQSQKYLDSGLRRNDDAEPTGYYFMESEPIIAG
jgi:hypothetical protein